MVLFDISLIFSDTNTHIGGHVTQGAILLPNSSARWTRERGRERKRGSAEHEMRFPSDGPIKATLSVPADPPPTHTRARVTPGFSELIMMETTALLIFILCKMLLF